MIFRPRGKIFKKEQKMYVFHRVANKILMYNMFIFANEFDVVIPFR